MSLDVVPEYHQNAVLICLDKKMLTTSSSKMKLEKYTFLLSSLLDFKGPHRGISRRALYLLSHVSSKHFEQEPDFFEKNIEKFRYIFNDEMSFPDELRWATSLVGANYKVRKQAELGVQIFETIFSSVLARLKQQQFVILIEKPQFIFFLTSRKSFTKIPTIYSIT